MGGLLGSTKLGLTLRRAGVEDKQKIENKDGMQVVAQKRRLFPSANGQG
jgi:hypothetical protein